MKKEILAALLLFILISVSILNCVYLNRSVEDICQHAETARELSKTGDLEKAHMELQKGRELFQNHQNHAAIFLRCDEIARIWDVFFEADMAMEENNSALYSVLCDELMFKLRDLADMEKISLKNIF